MSVAISKKDKKGTIDLMFGTAHSLAHREFAHGSGRFDFNEARSSGDGFGAEQVVMQRLHLRVAGIVLPVLDAKHGVVRKAAVLCDFRQVADALFQLGHDFGEGIGLICHTPSLGISALSVKAYMPSVTHDDLYVPEKPSSALRALRENLTSVLTALEISENAFAKLVKVDQKTVWRVLHSTTEPTLDTVSKLAKACRVEPWQLLAPDLEPNNPPMIASQSEGLKRLLRNISNTKEMIEGVLQDQGNTRPHDDI